MTSVGRQLRTPQGSEREKPQPGRAPRPAPPRPCLRGWNSRGGAAPPAGRPATRRPDRRPAAQFLLRDTRSVLRVRLRAPGQGTHPSAIELFVNHPLPKKRKKRKAFSPSPAVNIQILVGAKLRELEELAAVHCSS